MSFIKIMGANNWDRACEPMIINTDQIARIDTLGKQYKYPYALCTTGGGNNTWVYVSASEAQKIFNAIGVSL